MFPLQFGLPLALLALAPSVALGGGSLDGLAHDGYVPRANSHLLDGAPVSVGPNWIAAYDSEGMTFCPALGEDAPVTHEVRWTLDSISVGGAPVAGVDLYAEPSLVDGAVVYDRGGVVEHYEALETGLEQFFRLDRLPSRSGELIVRGQLSSGFDISSDAARGRLVLRDFAGRGVNIDTVVAIDADGDRVDGTVRRVDGRMEIVIPADFIATADLPLVVDPLFGVENPGTDGTFDADQVDIAFGQTGDGGPSEAQAYGLAYTRKFSATQSSIQAGTFTNSGASNGPTVLLKAFPLEYDQNPAIAFNRPNGKFVVAWESAASPGSQRDIEANSFHIETGSVDTRLALTATSLVDEALPDVGGGEDQNVSFYDTVVVVYTSKDLTGLFGPFDATVRTQAIDVEGSPISVAADGIDDPSVGDVIGVSISKSGGEPGRYVISLEDVDSSGLGTVHVASCSFNGEVGSVNTWSTESQSGKSIDQSDVAFDGTSGLLVARETDVATGKSYIVGRKLLSTGGSTLFFHGDPFEVTESDLGSLALRNESEPAAGLVGDSYLVAYTVETAANVHKTFLRSFEAVTCTSCEPETLVSAGVGNSFAPEIATRQAAGDLELPQAAIATNRPGLFSFSKDVPSFYLWMESVDGASPIQVSDGCGKPGFLALIGSTAIGSDDLRARLAFAEGTTLGVILNVNFSTPSLSVGDCELLPPNILLPSGVVIDSSTGAAFDEIPVPLPCNGILEGETLAFQCWVIGTTVSPAEIYPNVSFSNRVDLPLQF